MYLVYMSCVFHSFMANRDHSCAQNSSKAREVTEILTPPSAWILCRSFGQTGFSLLSKEKNSYRLFIDKTDNSSKKPKYNSLCFVKNRFFFDVVAIHQFIDVVTDSHSVESDTSQLLLHFEFLFPWADEFARMQSSSSAVIVGSI